MSSTAPTQSIHHPPVDWDEVHAIVQECFAPLVKSCQQQLPRCRVHSGRTAARAFYLFSYLTCEIPEDHAVEPIVVGVSFTPAASEETVEILADIVAEESGTIFFELPARQVPNRRADLLTTARELANSLSTHGEVVAQNLVQPSPPPPE